MIKRVLIGTVAASIGMFFWGFVSKTAAALAILSGAVRIKIGSTGILRVLCECCLILFMVSSVFSAE